MAYRNSSGAGGEGLEQALLSQTGRAIRKRGAKAPRFLDLGVHIPSIGIRDTIRWVLPLQSFVIASGTLNCRKRAFSDHFLRQFVSFYNPLLGRDELVFRFACGVIY